MNKWISESQYSYADANWGDKLTSFNGNAITYDSMGNPLSYDGRFYIWRNGRNLQKYEDDQYIVEFTYDKETLRQSKKIYDRATGQLLYEYRYYWGAGYVIAYTITDYTKDSPKTDTVQYLFDDTGTVYAFTINNQKIYLYEKDVLGNIMGIYHQGEKVVQYHYDDYGNIMLKDIIDPEADKYNQLYYRGYMYDRETDMYYLQSRYYVPEWGRFLNADIYVDTGTGLFGTNMFAYCDNDPINKIDPIGFWGKETHKNLIYELYDGSVGNDPIFNVDAIAEGDAYTDTKYTAINVFAQSWQGRHFDRHIRISEAQGEDTRGYYAKIHFVNAVDAFNSRNAETLNQELGFALHCLQDFSAHGNIDVDTWAFASHVTIPADDLAYDWKNDSDRGRTNKFDCLVVSSDKKRYQEASDLTVLGFLIFASMQSGVGI